MTTRAGASEGTIEDITHRLNLIYELGRVVGRTGAVLDVSPTGMARPAGEYLGELAEREQASSVLEIGLGLGLSTLFLARAVLKSRGGGVWTEERPVFTIDPFQERDWNDAGAMNIDAVGLGEFVEIVREPSELALPAMVKEQRTFSFAFVDGGHLFENAFVDVSFVLRLVPPGGLIVIDDRWMPAIRRAANYFVTNVGLIDESPGADSPGKRFICLRVPERLRVRRWDDFVEF